MSQALSEAKLIWVANTNTLTSVACTSDAMRCSHESFPTSWDPSEEKFCDGHRVNTGMHLYHHVIPSIENIENPLFVQDLVNEF